MIPWPSRMRSAHVQVGGDVPAHRRQVDEGDAIRLTGGDRHGDVDAHRGRADAALGRVDDDQASAGPSRGCDERGRPELLRAPVAQVQRLHPGIELAVVDRPDHHVLGARLQQPDALLDVVGRGDRQDGHVGEGRDGADLAAHVGKRPRRRCRIDDDHVLVRRDPGELLGALDAGQDPAGAAEDPDQWITGGAAKEEDSGVGHVAPYGRRGDWRRQRIQPGSRQARHRIRWKHRDHVLDSAA